MYNFQFSLPDHDPLTGMISRTALNTVLENTLALSHGTQNPFALILFDIDRFKLVNFGFGDNQGDAVLQNVALIAQKTLRNEDITGRWGGQQFLCILPDTLPAAAYAIAEKIRKAIESEGMRIGSNIIHATASFGIACFPDDGSQARQLMSSAEAALYNAKESGRNRTVLARELSHQPYGIGNMLELALREDRVLPAYQPIVDLKTGRIVAEEALAHVITPNGDVLPAAEFIDSARLLQFTYKIDRTIMLKTFARCAKALTPDHPPINHFVNISGNLLRHPEVVEELLNSAMQTCQSCGDLIGEVKPIVIEVTERELLGDIETARNLLRPFLDFGLRLALDDFGSGYSSFHYLAEFPFSFLKIEGSLIKRLTDPKVRTIVQGMQNTASDLGLITVAEFVENGTIANIAREIGIDWAQGYHFGKPSAA